MTYTPFEIFTEFADALETQSAGGPPTERERVILEVLAEHLAFLQNAVCGIEADDGRS